MRSNTSDQSVKNKMVVNSGEHSGEIKNAFSNTFWRRG